METVSESMEFEVQSTLASHLHGSVPPLSRKAHLRLLVTSVGECVFYTQHLNASRPWLLFWMLQSIDVLDGRDDLFSVVPPSAIVNFLRLCFVLEDGTSGGGYGGGPLQQPHLAPTYAAVCALCMIGTEEALASIPVRDVCRWMVSLRCDDGGFRMHHRGEVDVRAVYCAVVVSTLLNIADEVVDAERTGAFLAACQTYEGGITCVPGEEAHSGYSLCGVAASILIKRSALLDKAALRRWTAMRQVEGDHGLNGRTNKVVDACYAYWAGGTCALVEILPALERMRAEGCDMCDFMLLDYIQFTNASQCTFSTPSPSTTQEGNENDSDWEDVEPTFRNDGMWNMNQRSLQRYVLQCCQDSELGGLRDKPELKCDYYHTCYALAGLSIAENNFLSQYDQQPIMKAFQDSMPNGESTLEPVSVGEPLRLKPINPLINLRKERVSAALQFFGRRCFF